MRHELHELHGRHALQELHTFAVACSVRVLITLVLIIIGRGSGWRGRGCVMVDRCTEERTDVPCPRVCDAGPPDASPATLQGQPWEDHRVGP